MEVRRFRDMREEGKRLCEQSRKLRRQSQEEFAAAKEVCQRANERLNARFNTPPHFTSLSIHNACNASSVGQTVCKVAIGKMDTEGEKSPETPA